MRQDIPLFDAFYREEFQQAKAFCGQNPKSREMVTACKKAGYPVVLATNPIFPAVATESRIRWAGLEPEDFEFYTTYENSTHCKPNSAYYQDILTRSQIKPEECLMVGNDTTEDLAAATLGISVFLLTDCLINQKSVDINQYPHGDFDALINYLSSLKNSKAEQ